MDDGFGIGMLVFVAWYILIFVQGFFAYGTAYRKTKANGDNGVSLFGWLLVYSLAAMVPYLAIYQWQKSKRPDFN